MDIVRVLAEVDSLVILNLLRSDLGIEHPCYSLYRQCKLILMDWLVRLQHSYRKGNGAANWLSNYALHWPLGNHVFSVPKGHLRFFIRGY